MPDSPVAVLSYFDGRGHGERVRYALAAGGVAYRENLLVKRGDVDAVRPRCAFGQVPLLEMPDGTRVVRLPWATLHTRDRVDERGFLGGAADTMARTLERPWRPERPGRPWRRRRRGAAPRHTA